MSEVKTFGGTGFMLNGNLVAAVSKRGLLLRVGKDRYRDVLAWPGARPMEMRGRTMEGYVYIDPPVPTNDVLKAWLDQSRRICEDLAGEGRGGRQTKEAQRTDGTVHVRPNGRRRRRQLQRMFLLRSRSKRSSRSAPGRGGDGWVKAKMGAAAALLWRRRLAMSGGVAPSTSIGLAPVGPHGWEQRPPWEDKRRPLG